MSDLNGNEFRDFVDDDLIHNQLYSWIMGLINVSCVEYRKEFFPIYTLIGNMLDSGGDCIRSSVVIDGEEYCFEMSLDKMKSLED